MVHLLCANSNGCLVQKETFDADADADADVLVLVWYYVELVLKY